MTPIGFFAPMKSPRHDTPSGDREIARAVMAALGDAGFDPQLVSDLRTLDMTGDAQRQAALLAAAEREIPAIVTRGREAGWRAFVTYHNYYKAPDLIGPTVAAALAIPYAQIECTRARKRLTGPWAQFAAAAEAAADAAHTIFFLTSRDAEALRAYGPPGQCLVHLPPFLNRAILPPASDRSGPALVAGMMRPGDKLASYEIIAQFLPLARADWRIDIAGDGTARAQVEALMHPFGDRVRFLGRLDAAQMAAAYARARLFLWPGVNEAVGMVYLEAQAAGLPVVAQDRPGMRDVLAPAAYPTPDAGPEGLARLLDTVWSDPPDPAPIRRHIAAHHLRPAAADTLGRGLYSMIVAAP